MTQRQPEPALERGFIVAVLAQGIDSEAELAELRELADTALVEPIGELVQHRARPERRTYLGKGKLEELKRSYKESGAEVLLVDDELDPVQQRTLEDALQARVVDRTQLILDIFAQHARSAEGKLQVELAQLEYNLPRMRGMWKHLERLGGGLGSLGAGVGTRGPGESQLETDRRIARRRVTLLRRRLKDLSKQREVRRKERQRSEAPTVALAGYTNVGKSTLLNALTDADVSVNDRLFETLDPTTRSFEHDGRRYLVTDTVGFIRRLPTQLVQGFAATLEETLVADLVLLVVDASGSDERGRRSAPPSARESIPGRRTDLRPDGPGARRAPCADRGTLRRSFRIRPSLHSLRRRGKARRALRAGRADRRARRPGGRCSRSRAAATPRGTPLCALSRRRGARRAGTRAARALIELPIQRLREDAIVPARAYAGDAGLDLSACERIELGPGERALVGTGLAVAIPEGYAGFVQPRSGLAARHGLTVVNSPGLVDSGYRGELRVVLLNTDAKESFLVEPGMRIAQLVVLPVPELELVEVDELPSSERGVRGFGSSKTG